MKAFGAISLAVVPTMATLSACSTLPSPQTEAEIPATVARSYQYTMTSKHTGREYAIQVSAPIDPLPPGVKAPIIYVMDGNWCFGIATDIARLHQIGWAMEPAYALDLMEPMRPVVDRTVLKLIADETFSGADFQLQADGVCRLNPELARSVAIRAEQALRLG